MFWAVVFVIAEAAALPGTDSLHYQPAGQPAPDGISSVLPEPDAENVSGWRFPAGDQERTASGHPGNI